MTTTETEIRICSGRYCDQEPTKIVHAQHFDPDADEDGRAIGWSRVRRTLLCDDCLREWQEDEMVAVCDVEPIR